MQYALQILLILAFVTGGSSQISGWDDAAVQLIALPVLALGLWRLAFMPACVTRHIAVGVAGLIVLVPLLQLLSIPEWAWLQPIARQSMAADLAEIGSGPIFTWSLDPVATEQAVLFLVLPFALFIGTLGVGPDTHRRLLRTIMLLALLSLLLAFLQLGVPAESVLNPFPLWAHQFNGVFANQNHQAISLVVGLIIALTGMLASLPYVRDGLRQAWTPWVLGFVAVFMLCALPLTQSRGAVLIGTFATAAVPFALGLFSRQRLRRGWGARTGLMACVGLMLLGAWATIGWMQVDIVDELRQPMREATVVVGKLHAPLGTGVGAFVPAFEQDGPDELLLYQYINHAHNEYVQWWLESSWLGMAVAAIVLLALGWVSARSLQQSGPKRVPAVAAIIGVWAVLAHSWVDYPLRTTSLASVSAVLAAVAVASGVGGLPRKTLAKADRNAILDAH